MQKKSKPDLKSFTMRLPKDSWLLLKNNSAIEDLSMAEFLLKLLHTYKKTKD